MNQWFPKEGCFIRQFPKLVLRCTFQAKNIIMEKTANEKE